MFSNIWLSYGENYYSGDEPLQLFLNALGFRGYTDLTSLGAYVSTKMI